MAYAEFVVRQTDSIVSFIYHLLENYRIMEPELVFREQEEFNSFVDETYNSIDIFGDTYLPSDILYQLKPEAYKKALSDFEQNKMDVQ